MHDHPCIGADALLLLMFRLQRMRSAFNITHHLNSKVYDINTSVASLDTLGFNYLII